MPPVSQVRPANGRFEFRRLDVSDAMLLLEPAVNALTARGAKVILTVSPVPIQSTFMPDDCVVANEFSKSVLRICAERISKASPNVDYFPSYEIVRTAGLSAYEEDNVHVHNDVVVSITSYMTQVYEQG